MAVSGQRSAVSKRLRQWVVFDGQREYPRTCDESHYYELEETISGQQETALRIAGS